MADDDERSFIIFSDSKCTLQAILGQDRMHLFVLKVLECHHWLVQYHDKMISFYLVPSHFGIRGNERVNAAAKADLLRMGSNILIPYGELKEHISVLLKLKCTQIVSLILLSCSVGHHRQSDYEDKEM